MWTRSELKRNAKDQMKGRYWNYLGASLMPQLASYVISIPVSIISQVIMTASMTTSGLLDNNSEIFANLENMIKAGNLDFSILMDFYAKLFAGLSVPFTILTLLSLATSFLVMMPMMVGMNRWFIRSREEKYLSLSLCFSIFKKSSYFSVVIALIYQAFFNMLWFFAFYIPGIVKAYSYRMIPFILADNPNIGAKRALKLSCQMTKGYKFKIFILDLSFIGWYILGFMACCIGVVAVVPYVYATNAELYDTLKREAVDKGLCTMEELGYVMISNY